MYDKIVIKATVDKEDMETIILRNYLEECTRGGELYYRSTVYAHLDGVHLELRGNLLRCKCSLCKLWEKQRTGRLDNWRPMTFAMAVGTLRQLLARLCVDPLRAVATYYEIGLTMKMEHPAEQYIRQVEEASGRFLWNDANYPEACSLLGLLYEQGTATAQNIELANKMYLKGCELGDSGSMRYLAINYLEGKGLPKDYKRACSYLAQAVEHGNMSARIDLAQMIFHGQGTKQDPEKAIDLLEPCLNEKYGRAYQVLGEAFEYGLGVERNYPKAKELYQKALELGYEEAQQALDRLDKYC